VLVRGTVRGKVGAAISDVRHVPPPPPAMVGRTSSRPTAQHIGHYQHIYSVRNTTINGGWVAGLLAQRGTRPTYNYLMVAVSIFQSRRSCLTILGKFFTPMCLCHLAV